MGWLTVDEFKTLTGIKIDDTIVQTAIDVTAKTIVKKIFVSRRYEYGTSTSKHELIFPIADQDTDGVITTSDIDVWQEDYEYNETNLNEHVTSVVNNRRRSIVTMDGPYPTDINKLYIDYKIARQDIDDMIDELKELQKLLVVDYIFTNVPFSKLQRGITAWTINSVSVAFDQDSMIKAKEQNMIREKTLFDQLRPPRADGIAPGRMFHDRLDRYRHGVTFR